MRHLGAGVLAGLLALSIPAVADEAVSCVQQQLTDLGYAPGPVDGALGRRTQNAAASLARDLGLALPELDAGTAAQWCTEIAAVAQGPAAEILSSRARYVLPADVLAKLPDVPPERAPLFCQASNALALQTAPIAKISGFTSRMADVINSVEGARELEHFVGSFGAHTVKALVAKDAEKKRELVDILARWAEAGALLDTISCVRSDGSLITTGKCTEWTDPEGNDLSGMKDATFVTFLGAALMRAYYVGLADFDREGMARQHAAIDTWFDDFSKRFKTPTRVYFGLNVGWYWPSIMADLASGNKERARERLQRIDRELSALINNDGSIVERTTRGDRALWYHYTSIGEIVMSMELMRAAGLTPSAELEKRLHGAVDLFVAAVDDPMVLDKWARQRHNSRYDGKQEWDDTWPAHDMAGTWLHVYPYRYPDREAAVKLREKVPVTARSAMIDIDLGLGLGCIYNAVTYAKTLGP
jgi:hypothetical protein